jgi:hypothetical protein
VVAPGAKVSAGEVFELAKWVPAESAALRFGMWPANLPEAEILAAAAEVRAAGVGLVSDPAEEPWSEILWWDGAGWVLAHAAAKSDVGVVDLDAKAALVKLGARLTAAALKQHVPAGAKVWVNLPAPKELAAQLKLHESGSAVQGAEMADANYVLAGVLTADGPAYAWMHKSELDAGPRAKATADHSPGCSTTSQYPVRSDWVAMHDATGADARADSLNTYAARLAKVHGWLELADNPAGASSAAYYKLQLVRAANQAALGAEEAAVQDDRLQMTLVAPGKVTERRWVYVLDIDCHGAGNLLYPLDYSENQFPSDADYGDRIVLPAARALRVGAPYGVDTLVMLSTAQPLADPNALAFEGVAKTSRGAASPLEKLLTDTSRATRSAPSEVPTDWGVDLMTLHSVPKDAVGAAGLGR